MSLIHRSNDLIFTKGFLRVAAANLVPIPSGITVLNFAVVDFDPISGWNSGSFNFIIPQTGEYMISLYSTYKYTASPPSEAGVQIWLNGNQLRPETRDTTGWAASRDNQFSVFWQGVLAKNDLIDGRAYQLGSTDVFTVSSASSMEIILIS